MSNLLQSPFMEDSIQEVVPEVAKVAGKLSASSVLTARRRVRIVPQSGQNYTVGASGGANTVNILIQDGQSYADLLSAVLSFEVETWGGSAPGAGQWVSLDDGAYSVFRRALVSVNSTLMDDIDFLAKKVNAEAYATVSQDWYNSVGSMVGLWKASTTVYGTNSTASGATFIDKYDVADKQAIYAPTTQIGSNGVSTDGKKNKFFVPVSMLSSFFRNEMLFPLRNAGQLYLQLNLCSALEACVCANVGETNPNFRIKNLTLEMDFVDLHPTYVAMMDEIMERPGDDGVRWAFDAHLVSAQNLQGGASGNGQQSVIISKASQNLRSIQVITQSQTGLSNPAYPKQSTFANPGIVDIQTRIGSLYFPAFTSIGEHRCFSDLQNAFGSPASLDKSGVCDLQNYYNATTVPTASSATAGQPYTANTPVLSQYFVNATTPNPYAGGIATLIPSATSAPPTPSVYQRFSDMFMWAYCFDKLKHAVLRGIDLDGINTLTSSGSQIVVQMNANVGRAFSAGEGAVLTGIVRFTRVLEIKGGATRVIG